LYRFAYGYLKSDAEAEELVQEVFTKIWEKRADLKEELSFKSYLFTISFNIIRKHFRKKAYLADYLKYGLSDDVDIHTLESVDYESLFRYLNELVQRLPDRRKEIFIRSRFEGVSIEEIAKELKISHKTVENQLTDALRFLRINLSRENLPALLFLYIFVM